MIRTFNISSGNFKQKIKIDDQDFDSDSALRMEAGTRYIELLFSADDDQELALGLIVEMKEKGQETRYIATTNLLRNAGKENFITMIEEENE